ncbi:MAG: hypothetical protein NW220_01225 [Leptolyngbyaceae cyanobacterium bins.349]|nr:hypothetical protein [Leptolyngbyaceae cyanobacterium bins.349]
MPSLPSKPMANQQEPIVHPYVQADPSTLWRSRPGYLSPAGSNFESTHILLGRFLADHQSADPLPEQTLLEENATFEWGQGQPLEKVLRSDADLQYLMQHPLLFRHAITIIEPWHHVGHNPWGEAVRASLNVAYIAQKVADADSILYPIWSTGLLNLEALVPIITSGLAVVVEGGDPSIRKADTFNGAKCSLEDLSQLVEQLLLARSPISAPVLFICLGHQAAAHCHIRLIRRAVEQVLRLESLDRDREGRTLSVLQQTCQKIAAMGTSLKVRKAHRGVIAEGWEHPEFAVGPNEHVEVGDRHLLHYQSPDAEKDGIPPELITAHEVVADEFMGVIDTVIEYERDVFIAMFHSDEVNQEAILFANWAYRLLHDTLIAHRFVIAGSSLAWLLQLPYAVEILCSTTLGDQVVTECSATCILYKDFESKTIRRSFTCQFHPELFSDLQAIGVRQPPTYTEMKVNDGVRLFVRLLYEGMQE